MVPARGQLTLKLSWHVRVQPVTCFATSYVRINRLTGDPHARKVVRQQARILHPQPSCKTHCACHVTHRQATHRCVASPAAQHATRHRGTPHGDTTQRRLLVDHSSSLQGVWRQPLQHHCKVGSPPVSLCQKVPLPAHIQLHARTSPHDPAAATGHEVTA